MGTGGNYLLGLGPDFSISAGSEFNKVNYPEELVEFIEIDAKKETVVALSSDGRVYGWGNCNFNKFGPNVLGQSSKPFEIKIL